MSISCWYMWLSQPLRFPIWCPCPSYPTHQEGWNITLTIQGIHIYQLWSFPIPTLMMETEDITKKQILGPNFSAADHARSSSAFICHESFKPYVRLDTYLYTRTWTWYVHTCTHSPAAKRIEWGQAHIKIHTNQPIPTSAPLCCKAASTQLKVHSEGYVQNVCISKWKWQDNIKTNTLHTAVSNSSDINLPFLEQRLPLDTLNSCPPHHKPFRQ